MKRWTALVVVFAACWDSPRPPLAQKETRIGIVTCK